MRKKKEEKKMEQTRKRPLFSIESYPLSKKVCLYENKSIVFDVTTFETFWLIISRRKLSLLLPKDLVRMIFFMLKQETEVCILNFNLETCRLFNPICVKIDLLDKDKNPCSASFTSSPPKKPKYLPVGTVIVDSKNGDSMISTFPPEASLGMIINLWCLEYQVAASSVRLWNIKTLHQGGIIDVLSDCKEVRKIKLGSFEDNVLFLTLVYNPIIWLRGRKTQNSLMNQQFY